MPGLEIRKGIIHGEKKRRILTCTKTASWRRARTSSSGTLSNDFCHFQNMHLEEN
jgi:hypothetical protein